MICIEFSTENENSYLVNVVEKKIKQVVKTGVIQPEATWIDYHELIGGKVGESITIVWSQDQTTVSSPIKTLKFV